MTRKPLDIDMQKLKELRLEGYSITMLAKFFGCGNQTIFNRLKDLNMTQAMYGLEEEKENRAKVERWRLALP